MVDPIGITGTTLAVASLLYSTCRTISDIIGSYKHAPKEYEDLARELNALQNTLNSLQTSLQGTSDTSLSPEQRESLKDLDLPLTNCNKVCEDFQQKLSSLRSNSTEDHTAVWDRLRLHFNKSDVKFLREKLNTAQATVQVALSVSTLFVPSNSDQESKLKIASKTVAQSQVTLDTFQETTAATMSELSGKVETIALAIDALSISGVDITQHDVEVVQRTLNEHGLLLKQCLLFCTSALNAAHASTSGTHVKHVKAMNHARQIIGTLGPSEGNAQPVIVDMAEADNAFQGIGIIQLAGLSQEGLDFLAGK